MCEDDLKLQLEYVQTHLQGAPLLSRKKQVELALEIQRSTERANTILDRLIQRPQEGRTVRLEALLEQARARAENLQASLCNAPELMPKQTPSALAMIRAHLSDLQAMLDKIRRNNA